MNHTVPLRTYRTSLQSKEPEKDKEREKKKEDSPLLKSARDSTKLSAEAQHGLIAQVLKDVLFSSRPGAGGNAAADGVARLQGIISSTAGFATQPVQDTATAAAQTAETDDATMVTA